MAGTTKITLCDIYGWREDTLISKLREFNFIPQDGDYKCHKCDAVLKLQKKSNSIDGYVWRCNNFIVIRKQKRTRCGTEISIRTKTFFEKSHLEIWQILGFAHLWVCKASLSLAAQEVKMSLVTAVDWASFCREVLLDKYLLHPQKIGGPGCTVEIDESKFGRRKYHRGHRVEGQWVFGGFERGSGKVFMIPVEKRNSDTLLPIIRQWVLPGTTIISDCWRAYDCLDEEGYLHLTVNHSISFKDAETGAHTNSIEGSWRHAKDSISASGRRKHHLAGNLAKYMFLKSCTFNEVNPTKTFFQLAASLYNPLAEPLPDRGPEEVVSDYESDDNE